MILEEKIMAFSSRVKSEMRSQFNKAYLRKFQQKVIPQIKNDLRVDSGDMREATEARIEDGAVRAIVGEGLDYPYSVELRLGVFADGSTLAGSKEGYAKFANG